MDAWACHKRRGKPFGKPKIRKKGVRMGTLFKHIRIENFCAIKVFETDLYNKTLISGFNKEGKSTIRNAVLWVLTDKLADNSSAGDNIRPHDENGNRIDNVEIRVDLTVDIDGSEYILTKIQKQKWVKKRGTDTADFQGNENIYEISSVPKKAKDFEQFINDNICNTVELPFCINANAFLSLDSKKRRAKVLGLAKSFTDDDVIATDSRFEELRADLKVGTIDELMKRSKQTIAALKKNQAEIPVRIAELENQIIEYDFSALELEKNSLNDELKAVEDKQKDDVAIREQILKAKFDLSEIEQDHRNHEKDLRHDSEMELMEFKNTLQTIESNIKNHERDLQAYSTIAANNDKALTDAENQLALAKGKVFDDASLICPTCGQAYPAEKAESMRTVFENNCKAEMDRLIDYIDSLKAGKADMEKKVEAVKEELDYDKEAKKSVEVQIKVKETELSNVNVESIKDNAEYKAKQAEIEALKAKVSVSTFDEEKAEIKSKIAEVERKLAQVEANNRIDERIGHLRDEQRVVGQNVLKQERIIALLEDYSKAKIAMLEDSVNQFFSIIKWRFFETQINGGMSEVCRATVGGEDYDKLLNKSDRILCQVDLVCGFMKANNVLLPVMFDDAESIDANRLPEIEGQMIVFKRDDCKLTVKEM